MSAKSAKRASLKQNTYKQILEACCLNLQLGKFCFAHSDKRSVGARKTTPLLETLMVNQNQYIRKTLGCTELKKNPVIQENPSKQENKNSEKSTL